MKTQNNDWFFLMAIGVAILLGILESYGLIDIDLFLSQFFK